MRTSVGVGVGDFCALPTSEEPSSDKEADEGSGRAVCAGATMGADSGGLLSEGEAAAVVVVGLVTGDVDEATGAVVEGGAAEAAGLSADNRALPSKHSNLRRQSRQREESTLKISKTKIQLDTNAHTEANRIIPISASRLRHPSSSRLK